MARLFKNNDEGGQGGVLKLTRPAPSQMMTFTVKSNLYSELCEHLQNFGSKCREDRIVGW
jgi:hypothetical protein